MPLRRGVHNARGYTCNAQAEKRLHLSGFFDWWPPGICRQHGVSCTAKWAVGGFSDALAMEVAPFGVKICTLEPGGIRTNFARRAGQDAPELLPDYEPSVGQMLKHLKSIEGRQEGDPRKIADLIVQLANHNEVPLRLILGVDAEKRVQQGEARRASDAEKWRHLTISTVFENGESIPELVNH
jgi:NAD(P)-dependent dehydrogenase (short-subunit alcohol dehydrogenase family)